MGNQHQHPLWSGFTRDDWPRLQKIAEAIHERFPESQPLMDWLFTNFSIHDVDQPTFIALIYYYRDNDFIDKLREHLNDFPQSGTHSS